MRRVIAVLAAVSAAAVVPFAGAAPTCTGAVPQALCGDRVIAEAIRSLTFLQYEEAFPALEAIEAIAPDVVEVYTLAEAVGDAAAVSAGGLDIPVIRLTDEKVTGPKKQVAISLSVHGQETAGREGGLRYIEDVARWWATDNQREIYAGEKALPLATVMGKTETWICVCNPDGWNTMDLGGQAVTARGNANGTDLNREFPTMGWPNLDATPLSDPEAIYWAKLLRSKGKFATATDIHGELTSANNAFADLMWPAGQWSPLHQQKELQLGLDSIATIERKFADDGVVIGMASEALGVMRPSVAATGYDVVGYDDGGFMGDWFTQELGAVEIDAENFLSHIAPGNIWVGALEQAHVAGVRGLMEAVIVSALFVDDVKTNLTIGRVAYVFTPQRIKAAKTAEAKAYDASQLDYFPHLARDVGVPVTAIDPADIASGTAKLSSYDSLVLADLTFPTDRLGRKYDQEKYVAALDAFAKAGGQLVLTDKAIQLLTGMGFGDDGAIQEAQTNAGHINFGDRDHDWEKDLVETASQTYYEVPVGFSPTSQAPHYGVDQAMWEAAGGTTVGTVGADDDGADTADEFTALGELPRGVGKISIYGAVLPTPTAESDPLFGLASYGVTIAGGQAFHAILAYQRPGAPAPGPAPAPQRAPDPAPAPPTKPVPLPATGADPALAVVALLVTLGAVAVRRRRTA
ncbi:MAG TPA: M14 family zinc carboxypeptidase [Mycobacteriales bacterium]|nr:M14 family zinc carboxypeptidase [Mycobacteriales bacterium]